LEKANSHIVNHLKTLLLALIIIMLAPIITFAQEETPVEEPEQTQIDSLKKLITQYTPDGVKAKIYYDISVLYTNYDSVLKYSLLSLKVEEQIKRESAERLHAEEKKHLMIFIFSLAGALIVVSIFIFFIFRILNIKKRANIDLTEKNGILISQKAEIEAQRDEIASQRDEIEVQKNFITEQMYEVEQVNHELIQSLSYARRIQLAALSSSTELSDNFKDAFIIYRPRNIVSGDYYRTEKIGRFSVMVTADCTGHGIPGAVLSILGISALKEYMRTEEDADKPGVILDRMRNFIKTTLNSQTETIINDGMDMSICAFDLQNMEMHYAIANQKVHIVRGKEIITLKGDRMPVGRCSYEKEHFQSLIEKICPGDMVYMFSDGIQDQFGEIDSSDSSRQRKFSSRRLSELLASIAHLSADEQFEAIDKAITDWKGNCPQTDDMTLVGIRI